MTKLKLNKYLILIVIVSLVLFSIGLWIGGKNKLVYSEFNFDPDNMSKLIKTLDSKNDKKLLSIENRYNLSVLHYKSLDNEKAKSSFHKLVNSGTGDHEVLKSGFYNLGNALFNIAEAEKDKEKALQLYQESLKSYRGALELTELDKKYFDEDAKNGEDIVHNFILTKNRIKILADALKNQKEEKKQQQNPYELLKQIETNESSVKKMVLKLQESIKIEDKQALKEDILKLRKENIENLAIIRQQIMKTAGPNQNKSNSMSNPTPQPLGNII